MSTRRKFLTAIPAVTVAAITAQPVFAETPVKQALRPSLSKPSPELRKLIDAHRTAYRAFVETIRVTGAGSGGPARAGQIEEKALLAVCAFRAQSQADRRAKARYLLEIEARGELDLPQHMRAVLRATFA
jgi:uncharacterized membrane protein